MQAAGCHVKYTEVNIGVCLSLDQDSLNTLSAPKFSFMLVMRLELGLLDRSNCAPDALELSVVKIRKSDYFS